MPAGAPSTEDAGAEAAPDGVQLRLTGYEGPLDLLLDLARRQAVDLAAISVLDLADQYAAAIDDLGRVGLARAADWLVMAAWLTWLKSCLLLPRDPREAQEAEKAAATLAEQLAAKERVRATLAFLDARPRLGRDVWARGKAGEADADVARLELVSLLRACLVAIGAPRAGRQQPRLPVLWRPPDALARMRAMLAVMRAAGGTKQPAAAPLARFLPAIARDPPRYELRCRAAVASTLLAGLELARVEEAILEQDTAFGAIGVGVSPGEAAKGHRTADGQWPA